MPPSEVSPVDAVGNLSPEASISGPSPDRKSEDVVPDDTERRRQARLVERAREGDREAFGELYRRHHPAVYRLVRFHLGDGAEDAVADTFLRAWTSLHRYRDTGAPFVAWLYGIARHVVADARRAARRTEPRADLPDRPVDTRERDDERLALAAALAGLPGVQRTVIELKFLVGLDNTTLGAALGKSPGAINALQWRAIEALKRLMGSV